MYLDPTVQLQVDALRRRGQEPAMSAEGPVTASRRRLILRRRFVGAVPGYANGGVIAGALAAHLRTRSSAIAVRLERPVPLEHQLTVVTGPGEVRLEVDDTVLAVARPTDDAPPLPAPLSAVEASRTEPVVPLHGHPAPGCFVCGPAHGTGLDLQPGRVADRGLVATVWTPRGDLAGPDGLLPPPIVWAALDCPGWYGAAGGRPALLGSITGHQRRPLAAEHRVLVSGWPQHRTARKTIAGSAIHTLDGELVAVATSIWIHPKEHDR
jgi:hypothetical protein